MDVVDPANIFEALKAAQAEMEIARANLRADTAQEMLAWTRITTIAIIGQALAAAAAVFVTINESRKTRAAFVADQTASLERGRQLLSNVEALMVGLKRRIYLKGDEGPQVIETDASLEMLDLLTRRLLEFPLSAVDVEKALEYRKAISLSLSEWKSSRRAARAYLIGDRFEYVVSRHASAPTANTASEALNQSNS